MIKVFDKRLNYIGSLDIYESFQCSLKYRDVGSFSISTLLNKNSTKLLDVGNFIQYKEFAGMIDSVQKTEDESKSILKVSGYSLEGLLLTRIIWKDEYFNGKSEEFLRKIVLDNAIKPTNIYRKIPFLELGELSNLPQLTERNTEHENLLKECIKVCSVKDYGFSIRLDARNKKMLFKVYEGKDKTNTVVIGSEFDNVLTQDYTFSNKDTITTCLVKNDALTIAVGENVAGFDRKETAFKSSKSKEELTDEQFRNVLIQEGEDKIEHDIQCLDVDINNVRLELGDKITVKSKAWGIGFKTRVEEKQITLENGIETETYLLGKDIKFQGIIK